MTKKKSVPRTATALRRALELKVKKYLRELRSQLGFNVANASSNAITVALGNKRPSGCLVNRTAPELTQEEKKEIRNIFTKLAEDFNLKLIAKTISDAGKQMICLFELKPSAA